MMIEWLGYVLVVSALVSVAAWLGERGAWARGWSVRWVWAGAMAVSVALPVVAWLSPSSAPAVPPMVVAPGAFVLESLPLVHLPAAATMGPSAEALALGAWAAVSGALLLMMALLSARLWLRRRRWSVQVVEGVEVLVSERTGPAAMGVWRGRVVVPRWALGLSAERRRLLVLHEAEHVRAGDPRLALAGLVVLAMAPWNVPLWWQLRRLRLAIEVDCDARVLRQTTDARGYGSLLLEVGQHRAHLALALAEPRSMLEKRIRMIMRARTQRGTVRALGLAAAAVVVMAVACGVPGPAGPSGPTEPTPASPDLAGLEKAEGEEVAGEDVQDGEIGGRDYSAEPTFTPMTVRPELRNPEQVSAALREHYPPSLRDAGIGGAASVWFFIQKSGAVEKILIHESSGYEALDSAAVRIARLMEFGPAYNGDERVPVWVAIPIRFESGAGEARVAPDRRAERPTRPRAERQEAEARHGEVARKPTFTPMTEPPRLINVQEIQRLLQESYPQVLRDAGIRGATNVWFFIDDKGVVQKVLVNRSSGYDAFDEAALAVGRVMRFSPARNRDEVVPVWVAFDIVFEVQ